MSEKTISIIFKITFAIAILVLLPIFGGLGSKLGLWEPMTGFRMTMDYMNYSAVAALVVLYMSLKYFLKDIKKTIISFIALVVFTVGGYQYGVNQEAQDWTGVRGVHDVTTDMVNLPKFEALLDAPGRTNSFDYPQETADRQRAKFPWVKPIITQLSEEQAYARALNIAQELGWVIVAEDPARGRFEATDFTKWFNFNDDIVVRVSADTAGSKVDLRSLTRVGGSDHGLGAIRIMRFTKAFNAE